MNRMIWYTALVTILAAVLGAKAAESPAVAVEAAAVEVSVEVLEPQPLPFQALRLRLVMRNVGKHRLEGLSRVEHWPGVTVLPTAASAEAVGGSAITWQRWPGIIASPQHRGSHATTSPVELGPGESQSVTFCAVGSWGRSKVDRPTTGQLTPLFPAPGTYRLLKRYQIIPRLEAKEQVKEIPLVVREPEGDDRAVYELLRRNPALVGALVWPLEPPAPALVPALRDILERYPKSSYADYARLQLAQHLTAPDPVEVMPEGRSVALVREPSSRDPARVAKAASQLEDLLPARFPYQPYVWLKFQSLDRREVPGVATLFDRYYPDSLEWISFRKWDPAAVADWTTFRKLRPREGRPDDPDLQPRPAPPFGDSP